jgi:hypothetical protein
VLRERGFRDAAATVPSLPLSFQHACSALALGSAARGTHVQNAAAGTDLDAAALKLLALAPQLLPLRLDGLALACDLLLLLRERALQLLDNAVEHLRHAGAVLRCARRCTVLLSMRVCVAC